MILVLVILRQSGLGCWEGRGRHLVRSMQSFGSCFAPAREVWRVEDDGGGVLHRLICVGILTDNLINKNYCHGITFLKSSLSSCL